MEISQKKILVLLPIILIALFISTFKLTESPRTWYDDGLFMQIARNVAHFNSFGVQSAPGEINRSIATYVTTGYPVTYPIGLIFKLAGVGLLQARIVMVIFLMFLVVVSFVLISRLFGYKRAVISAILLASFAPLYGNGKIVLGEVPGLFFLILLLWSLNRWETSKKVDRRSSIFIGLAAGLTVVTKPIFILLVPAVLVAVSLKRKTVPLNTASILYVLASFLIPAGLFFVTYFGKDDSLLKVLAFYGNNYSAQLADIKNAIFNNSLKAFKEATPAYFMSMMFFWLAFAWLRIRQEKAITLAESTAIMFSILIGLAWLKTPGWYRYFFPGHVLALLFFPVSFLDISKFVNRQFLKNKLPAFLPLAGLVAIIAVQFYQVGFSSWVASDYHSTRSKELAEYFRDFKKEKSVFVYEAAETVTFLPSDNYYQFFHITGDRFFGDRQPLITGVPDEVIISSKSMLNAREYLKAYKLKTKLYRDLYLVFEKK